MQIIRNQCCPICGGSAEPIIYLPNYPVTEIYQNYGENAFKFPTSFDQSLNFCEVCEHGFLGSLLPKEFIYKNYNTHTAKSEGSLIAIENFYTFIEKNLQDTPKLILDIGANDSSLLRRFKSYNSRLIGIDPNIADNSGEIECHKGYVEDIDMSRFESDRRVFICSHTLEHIYDPSVLLESLRKVAIDSDEFYFQFPSLELLVRDCRFDQVHHQHIHYYSLKSFSLLLNRFGFELLEYYFDSDHYGALMCSFKKSSNAKGARNIKEDLKSLRANDIVRSNKIFTSSIESSNTRIAIFEGRDFYCYGASLMLPIISYYMPNLINSKSIIDADFSKLGMSYVNFDREIVSENSINFCNESFVITALSTKKTTRRITQKLIELNALNIILPFNTL